VALLLAAAVMMNGDREAFMRQAGKAIEAANFVDLPTWESQE
jgi:hypothetical protein